MNNYYVEDITDPKRLLDVFKLNVGKRCFIAKKYIDMQTLMPGITVGFVSEEGIPNGTGTGDFLWLCSYSLQLGQDAIEQYPEIRDYDIFNETLSLIKDSNKNG